MKDQAGGLRRAELTVTLVVFVTVFFTTNRVASLPLRALIKEQLGLPAETMAEVFAVAGLAWYLKPLAGWISDQVPLAGSRRKHYLVLSALAGALTWGLAAVVPLRIELLVPAMIGVNAAAVLGNSVVGGLLVDVGRAHQATGRLSVLRVVAMNTASLIAGPLGGWLAARAFTLTAMTGAVLMAVMAVAVALLLKLDQPQPRPVRLEFGEALAQLRRRRIWSVAAFTGLWYLAPGFQSLLYYHQHDQLGFTDQTIGYLAALNCAGGMLGALGYFHGSSHFRLRGLIIAGTLLSATCTLGYLFYDSLGAALVIEPLAGCCFLIGVMPIQELTARASPPAHEAFAYAAILAVGNAAIALSDVIGSHLAARFSLDIHDLIVINAASVVASLVLLLLVSSSLLGETEEEAGA